MSKIIKRSAYKGNTNLKGVGLKINWTKKNIKEYDKCMNDIIYFAENYFKIINLDHGLITIPLYDYQKEILKMYQDNRFVIGVQARQSGKTTTATIFFLWFMIFNDYKTIALLAHKAEGARDVLSKIQLAYEHLPDWLQHGVVEWNKGSCELENGSKILAGSTSGSAARGKAIDILYLDEFAFVPTNIAIDFMTSVYPTISSGKNTKIFITSTPDGMNLFYKMVEDAKHKRNDYKYIEILWDRVPGRDKKWKEETIRNTSAEAFRQEMECVAGDTYITIRDKYTKEIRTITIEEFFEKY